MRNAKDERRWSFFSTIFVFMGHGLRFTIWILPWHSDNFTFWREVALHAQEIAVFVHEVWHQHVLVFSQR